MSNLRRIAHKLTQSRLFHLWVIWLSLHIDKIHKNKIHSYWPMEIKYSELVGHCWFIINFYLSGQIQQTTNWLYFLVFFSRNSRFRHFMQIDSLLEMLKLVFWENKKKMFHNVDCWNFLPSTLSVNHFLYADLFHFSAKLILMNQNWATILNILCYL